MYRVEAVSSGSKPIRLYACATSSVHPSTMQSINPFVPPTQHSTQERKGAQHPNRSSSRDELCLSEGTCAERPSTAAHPLPPQIHCTITTVSLTSHRPTPIPPHRPP